MIPQLKALILLFNLLSIKLNISGANLFKKRVTFPIGDKTEI